MSAGRQCHRKSGRGDTCGLALWRLFLEKWAQAKLEGQGMSVDLGE